MAFSSCVTSLILVMAISMTTVKSGPSKIVRRQAGLVDTSDISDADLIECFALLAAGGECPNLATNVNDIPVSEVVETQGCKCVKNYQCRDNDISGSSLLSVVNVRTSCFDPFDVCCINIDTTATPPPPTPSPVDPKIPVGNPGSGCGRLNPTGVSSTLVGFRENQAQFGQFPWMAAVMTTGIAGSNGANVYVCGASLIHPKVVLTAAHYMHDKEAQQLAVRLGEWNFKLPTEPIIHQDIRVQRIALHPQFSPSQLTYDVALLFLEHEAQIGPTVSPICLPNPSEIFDGANCYTSGWGKDAFGESGRYQQILKSLKLPVVNHQQCQTSLQTTRLGSTFNLSPTFVCAGGERGIDTCTGDGGSPLVCPMKSDSTRYAQAGIVAWGIGCGEHGIPGVYASVSEAVTWIGQELLTSMSFDIRNGFNTKR